MKWLLLVVIWWSGNMTPAVELGTYDTQAQCEEAMIVAENNSSMSYPSMGTGFACIPKGE